MKVALSLEQFKALALQYQNNKKRAKKKVDIDLCAYILARSFQIKKRCGYFK